MEVKKLTPADIYTVYNKTTLSDTDRELLTMLYMPLIGSLATSLYLSLWSDLKTCEIVSSEFTHDHLTKRIGCTLIEITKARRKLEGIGLLKTYVKENGVEKYVYCLFSPLSASDFFKHPVLNILLYNHLGKLDYDKLTNHFVTPNITLNKYTDITASTSDVFKITNNYKESNKHFVGKQYNKLNPAPDIDFELIKTSIPLLSDKALGKDIKELINQLAFVYNLSTTDFINLIPDVINERGTINSVNLRKKCRKYYQFENNDELPYLVNKTQPEYLKTALGDASNRSKMIYVFESTSPYHFLKNKYATTPTNRDLKLIEDLMVEVGLKPGVVNVLIDYVLRTNNAKLNKNYLETIAAHWKRLKIETVPDAMSLAEKEHKKYSKAKATKKASIKTEVKVPGWFNEQPESVKVDKNEEAELKELLSKYE